MRLAEAEAELRQVETALARERQRAIKAEVDRQAHIEAEVLKRFDQNIEPALIAEALRVPRERVETIIAEARERTRLRRGRHTERD